MSKKSEKLVDMIQQNYGLISNSILPQSQQFSRLLADFHQKQSQGTSFITSDFESIELELERVIQTFKSKVDQCQANVQEIDTQWDKVKKFANTGKGYLNAKSQEIKSKIKNLEAVSTGLKQTVGKIKPEKLAQLPVEKNKSLQKLFQTLYIILYHEKQNNFDWKAFRKLALKHQNGQDFVFRLVNLNFKDLKPQEHEMLMILKNDPEFENTCINSQFAYDIIDLADWTEYICVGKQFSDEKNAAQKQYEKIRKDMNKRSGGSLDMSKKFWKQALEQIDRYQNNLLNLQGQLKTLKINSQNSLESIKDGDQGRKQQIAKLNNILA